MLATWNTQKRPYRLIDDYIKAIITATSTNAIIFLQEVPTWRHLNDQIFGTHVLIAHPNTSTAILLPVPAAKMMQHRGQGQDWISVQLYDHLFFGIHANEVHKPSPIDNRYTTMRHEIQTYIASRPDHLPIITGIDANTTPYPNQHLIPATT